MEQLRNVSPTKLMPSPLNPRKHLGSLAELKASIEAQGVLQPLLARERNGALELVFGHRRRAAAAELGLKAVPVMVREMTDAEVLEAQLVENAQREDVGALEEALAYRRLVDEFGYSLRKLAERVGTTKSGVGQRLSLLTLPAALQKALGMGELDTSLAFALVALRDGRMQARAFEDVTSRQMSTRDAINFVRRKYIDRPAGGTAKHNSSDKAKARKVSSERLALAIVRAASAHIERRAGFTREEMRLMLLGASSGIDFAQALAARGWEVNDTLLRVAAKAGESQLRALVFESCVTGWAVADEKNAAALAKAFRLDVDEIRARDLAESVFSKATA